MQQHITNIAYVSPLKEEVTNFEDLERPRVNNTPANASGPSGSAILAFMKVAIIGFSNVTPNPSSPPPQIH